MDLFNSAVPDDVDLRVLERAVLHDFGGAELVAPMNQSNLAAEFGQKVRFFHRGIAAAHHQNFLVLKEKIRRRWRKR